DDRYLLERILLEMDSEHKIYERNDNSCEICFSCKEIYNDIVFLGGMEKKSLIMRFPNIPHDYVKHFTRGYFDGDGSVNKRNVGYLIGTYEFCNSLNLILRENGIRISSIKQKHPESGLDNNCYCLNIFKKLEFEKFEQFMCGEIKNNSLLLTRKHQNSTKNQCS
ncbi:MAG: LAGLIDADG family homing endonuclease, partial [Bacilli bacterium]|nr:LAGLIDADG family homing endonuclease [Bacilli bacterium]